MIEMLFDEIFNSFFDDINMFGSQPVYKSTAEQKKCPLCGRTLADFRRIGKFGCSECYKTFKEPIAEVMRQVHSNSVHTGKIPSKSGEGLKLKRQYDSLKRQLQDAVAKEDYETAARLHKQIREIENEVKRS